LRESVNEQLELNRSIPSRSKEHRRGNKRPSGNPVEDVETSATGIDQQKKRNDKARTDAREELGIDRARLRCEFKLPAEQPDRRDQHVQNQ
jgi:hypothetical protein